jgi:intracellular sulfur oxidation DsrE/DsrF family protein
MHVFKAAAIGGAGLAIMVALAAPGQSQTKVAQPRLAQSAPHSVKDTTHHVVIQVTQNDPAVMNMALNNAENLTKFYQDKGEKVEIEFVAYGAGLNMVRGDTSPVKDRLEAISGSHKNITFSGCGNTLANQSKMENKEISLVPQAHLVATGIARVVELQELGWTYVRP